MTGREPVVVNSLTDLEDWLAGPQEQEQEPEPTRTCVLCKATHPMSHFRSSVGGRSWMRCETCRTTGSSEERRRHLGRLTARAKNLKRMYGITVEEYDGLRAAQDFRCAICKRHEDELPAKKVGRPRLDGEPIAAAMKLYVDHDHETKAIRGLLCGGCNSGIGYFEDRADWMARAITYVSTQR